METNYKTPSLSIIVPCYNEEEGIKETIDILKKKIED